MYTLPEGMRDELKRPLGPLITEKQRDKLIRAGSIVSVGDVVTIDLYNKGCVPKIAIVDFKNKRSESSELKSKIQSVKSSTMKAENPAGQITSELWQAVATAYSKEENVRIEVSGEEDLAALACIFLAPSDDYTVLYGMPDMGLVAVKTTKEKRREIGGILERMVV